MLQFSTSQDTWPTKNVNYLIWIHIRVTKIKFCIICLMYVATMQCLTLFVSRTSEWVASPGPSNIGAKRGKVWVGHDKPDKNVHILTVSTAVLPLFSDTTSLSSSPIYSESRTHPSSELSSSCPLSIYPKLQKQIFLWLAIIFLLIWTSKQCSRKW